MQLSIVGVSLIAAASVSGQNASQILTDLCTAETAFLPLCSLYTASCVGGHDDHGHDDHGHDDHADHAGHSDAEEENEEEEEEKLCAASQGPLLKAICDDPDSPLASVNASVCAPAKAFCSGPGAADCNAPLPQLFGNLPSAKNISDSVRSLCAEAGPAGSEVCAVCKGANPQTGILSCDVVGVYARLCGSVSGNATTSAECLGFKIYCGIFPKTSICLSPNATKTSEPKASPSATGVAQKSGAETMASWAMTFGLFALGLVAL